jgi:predicted PurR-regulated permease PerM
MNRTVNVNITARSVLVALGILFAAWLASKIPDILVMLLIALIIASAMLPGINHFHKQLKWKRPIAILTVFGLLFGVLILLGLIVVPTLVDQAQTLVNNLPAYTAKVQQTYSWVRALDQRFHLLPSMDEAATAVSSFAAGWLASTLGWAGKLLGGVFTIFLILIITFFLLLDGPELKRGALSLVPPQHRPVMEAQFEPVALKLGAYVQGVMTSIGFLTTYLAIALSIAGEPLALVLALLAGLMEIIPMVGSLIGSIPAILIALTVSWQLALIVVVIFLVGNFIQGNFVAPYVFSRSVNVSPVMITFALLIGGSLMGITGALIAVPVMAALQVLVQNLYVEPMERRAMIESAPEGAGPLGPDALPPTPADGP